MYFKRSGFFAIFQDNVYVLQRLDVPKSPGELV